MLNVWFWWFDREVFNWKKYKTTGIAVTFTNTQTNVKKVRDKTQHTLPVLCLPSPITTWFSSSTRLLLRYTFAVFLGVGWKRFSYEYVATSTIFQSACILVQAHCNVWKQINTYIALYRVRVCFSYVRCNERAHEWRRCVMCRALNSPIFWRL